MALKTQVDDLDGIPEAFRDEYEEKNGKYVLRLEGDVPGLVPSTQLAEANAKLAEFRDNNVTLKGSAAERETKLEALKAQLSRFDGVDPEEYGKLKARVADLQKTGVAGADDVTLVVQRAVSAAVTPLQKRLDEVTAREKEAEAREQKSAAMLARKTMESELTSLGLSLGVSEPAIPDYVARGLEIFRYEDGQIVAKNGDTPVYSPSNPTMPLTPDEWAESLIETAPHLFKGSGGGGAAASDNTPPPPRKTIQNDPLEFGRNIEAIARGEVIVQQ
ncbi:MAG TPA: hypothetical protein VMW52_11055 [Phycisphaerae bacterium]|nr:hypothetical protein [Phycisphaerae bacterium]